MTPSVLLICGHCDVQGVVTIDRMSLVDEAAGEIKQVALLQGHIKNGLADLTFIQVAARFYREHLLFISGMGVILR